MLRAQITEFGIGMGVLTISALSVILNMHAQTNHLIYLSVLSCAIGLGIILALPRVPIIHYTLWKITGNNKYLEKDTTSVESS